MIICYKDWYACPFDNSVISVHGDNIDIHDQKAIWAYRFKYIFSEEDKKKKGFHDAEVYKKSTIKYVYDFVQHFKSGNLV